MRNTAQEIHAHLRGRWSGFVSKFISADLLDGKGHPCPKCGGNDRFNVFDDFEKTGGANCRACHNTNNSDGIALYAWRHDITQGEAIRRIATELGINNDEPPRVDIILEVATDKRMPVEAFKQFGPKVVKQGRGRRDVARLEVYNAQYEACGTFDIWSGDKGRFGRGSEHGLFLQHDDAGKPRPFNEGETILLCEGVKDAAALVGLGYRAVGLPTSYLNAEFAPMFKGVHVLIVPDLDEVAFNSSYRSGGNLRGYAASIKVARLPGEVRTTKGDDVRDILRKPNGESLVRSAIENAEEWQPRDGEHDPTDGRPEVFVTLTEGVVAEKTIEALGQLGRSSRWIPKRLWDHVRLYQTPSGLKSIFESEDPTKPKGSVFIHSLHPSQVRERITQGCHLKQERQTADDVEVISIPPPKWLVDAVYYRGHYGGHIPPLTGLIQAPTIRSDGTILQQPGYDKQTGLVYRPLIDFPKVPDKPTVDDAKRAAEKLLEVIADFPTSTPGDRSAWLAMLLTMIARSCVAGCVPMFTLNANVRGAGKSLAVDAASVIAYGRPAARQVFTRDEDEQRKLITAIAIEMTPMVLFDNVDMQLGGGPLDAALTSRTWSARRLGHSQTTGELNLDVVFTATGNNLAYGSDLSRRVLPINLMTPEESPEDRSGFTHPNLLGWVAESRPELAVAALTILRAYFVAGKPEQNLSPWGSFESWSDTIRGALVWAGQPDPIQTRQTATANDDSRELLGTLISGFLELQSIDPKSRYTVKDIERLITQDQPEAMSEAVTLICGAKFDGRRFGKKIRGFIGRNWRGYAIQQASAGGGVKGYCVVPMAQEGGYGGFEGSLQPVSREEPLVSHITHTHTCDTTRSVYGIAAEHPRNQLNPPELDFEPDCTEYTL